MRHLAANRRHASVVVVGLLSLAGCTVFQNDAQRSQYTLGRWPDPTIFTTGAVRTITQRTNRVTGARIVCTEPSPDIAIAIATLLQGELKAQTAAGAGGNASLTASASETVAELAGRSTALLGLRDGLYKACEAYANGIIGDDAYTLILTRYGQLMVTLFLGQDASAAAAQEAKATAPAPPTGTSSGAETGNKTGQGNSTPGTGGVPQGTPRGGNQTPGPNAAPTPRGDGGVLARSSVAPGPLRPISTIGFEIAQGENPASTSAVHPAPPDAEESETSGLTIAPAGGQKDTATLAPSGGTPPTEAGNAVHVTVTLPGGHILASQGQLRTVVAPALRQPAKPAASTPVKTAASPAAAASGTNQALVTMQQAYFNLNKDALSLLLTACVNENDYTRLGIAQGRGNPWVKALCDKVNSPRTIAILEELQNGNVKTQAQITALLTQLPP